MQHEDFVLHVDICQKASTMEDTLNNQIGKMTQLVGISQLHYESLQNWHFAHMNGMPSHADKAMYEANNVDTHWDY